MAYQIGEKCSTCHYCKNECPAEAIRFVGVEYAIDPEKCTECGICAKVCPSGVISNPNEKKEPVKHELIQKECDLLVLGGGGSGLVAAVKAAELSGKKVIVLEKAKKVGGNTNLGHGFIMRYSKLHEMAGEPDLRPEFIEGLTKGSPELSPALIRNATYALSDMFDWLCGYGGWEDYFELKTMNMGPKPFAMVDFPRRAFDNLKSTDHSMGPGWMGTYVIRKMMEQCEQLGVEVLTEHRAVKLLTDDDGSFTGVIADDLGGQTQINAKCCVIATGGFVHNKQIMDKVRPTFYGDFPVHSFSVASATGDAIAMGEEIGAEIDLETVKIPLFGPAHHPFNYSMVRMSGAPENVIVNLTGKRFTNEAAPPTMDFMGIMESQPRRIAWAILDDEMVDIIGQRQVEQSAHDPELQKGFVPYRRQLEEEVTWDLAAHKADTLEELGKLIGVDPEVFAQEILQYNNYCASGHDPEFEKDPAKMWPIAKAPYYALFLFRFNEGAEGGLVNDDHLRVLNKEGKPIKGIYTAGDCCKGLLKKDDNGGKFGEMPWAMASGYMAGCEAAEFIQ